MDNELSLEVLVVLREVLVEFVEASSYPDEHKLPFEYQVAPIAANQVERPFDELDRNCDVVVSDQLQNGLIQQVAFACLEWDWLLSKQLIALLVEFLLGEASQFLISKRTGLFCLLSLDLLLIWHLLLNQLLSLCLALLLQAVSLLLLLLDALPLKLLFVYLTGIPVFLCLQL